jgi:multisubunit Na+/H+ antiporter MnhG subunit
VYRLFTGPMSSIELATIVIAVIALVLVLALILAPTAAHVLGRRGMDRESKDKRPTDDPPR